MAIAIISIICAMAGRWSARLPFLPVLGACFVAGMLHDLTDTLYFMGVKYFWPWNSWAPALNILLYLDLIVLTIWIVSAILLYRMPKRGLVVASTTFVIFISYVTARAVLPKPQGILGMITGAWVQAAPQGTPVLDWW